jgi:hypothetical protein
MLRSEWSVSIVAVNNMAIVHGVEKDDGEGFLFA